MGLEKELCRGLASTDANSAFPTSFNSVIGVGEFKLTWCSREEHIYQKEEHAR